MPTTVRLLAGVFALTAMTGCSGVGAGETKTVTVEQPSSDGEASAPSPSPSPSAPSPSPEGAIAEADVTIDQVSARFVVTELRRRGSTVVLNARAEPTEEGANINASGQVSDTFSDGETEESLPLESDEFDGVALVDPEGRKKYLVARDPDGRCVCSNALDSAFVSRGAVNFEATLTAPPSNVQRVDLIVPRVRTFTDVPLSG